MPTEMDERLQELADELGLSYSELVRTILRNHTQTPFDPSDIDIAVDDDGAREAQMGGA